MKKLFDFNCTRLQKPAETISTAMLWCVERRIRGLRGKFAEAMGIGEHLPIIIPGGIKKIVMPRTARDAESIMEDIEFSQEKLGITKLYAMAHLNCGACSNNADPAFYETILIEGGRILRRRLPGVEIVTVFADYTGVHLVEEESLLATA